MPKATMASTNRRRNPNSFPDATTRALYRSLCRLKASPQLTCKVLLESLDRLNTNDTNNEQQLLHMIRANVQETVDSIINSTTSSDDEASSPQRRLALTMELAIQKAFDSSEQGASAADGEDSSVMSVVQPTRTNNKNSGIVTTTTTTTMSPTTTTMQTPSKLQQQTSLVAASPAVVSDSSTVASTETREDDDNDSLQLLLSNNKTKKNKFWALLLESLELSISSATTTSKKTRYEVYQLPGVASMNATQQQQLDSVRRSFEQEFLKVFGGNNHDQETCRTYIMQRDEDSTIYLQINIGKWMDYSKVSHNSNTMILCVVTPDDDYVALMASRKSSPYVTLVLSALDAALVQHVDRIADVKPHKVGDWCGEEPLELLQAARATRSGQAVGRFVQFALADMVLDPLVEMNKVSTASMLDRTKEQERLVLGAQHGRALAQTAAQVERDGATLTAANSNGLIVDSSAVLHNDRKRARDSELGKEGDCPRLEKVCWKWTGETTAAAAAWLSDDEDLQDKDLPKTKFKCGLTLEGTNVMEGLRQMMAKGYAKAPLPDFVRNAPTVGSSTIVVSDDAFVAEKNSFAAV